MASEAQAPIRRRGGARSAPTSPDPIEIAMEAEAGDVSPDSPARMLLVNQNRLVRLQITGQRAAIAVRLLTAAAGVSVALMLAWLMFQASQSQRLVIEPFSTPPALAERGITGEAIANRLMDHLNGFTNDTHSPEQVRGLSGASRDVVSLTIPQTGVSLSQLDQWLRQTLGHDTHVSGEVVVAGDGRLALVSRSGGQGLTVQRGQDTELDAMILRVAEQIYAREQPRSYMGLIWQQARFAELLPYARARTDLPGAFDRALAYLFIGNTLRQTEGDAAGMAAYRQAIASDPTYHVARSNLADYEVFAGRVETARRLYASAIAVIPMDTKRTALGRRQQAAIDGAELSELTGDFGSGEEMARQFLYGPLQGFDSNPMREHLAIAEAGLHRLKAAKLDLEADPPAEGADTARDDIAVQIRLAAEDWPGVIAQADRLIQAGHDRLADQGRTRTWPTAAKAIGLAELGRLDEAAATVGATALDCQPCVIARGRVAALSRQDPLADHWFSEAVRLSPSTPFANLQWGRALLARGQADAAIERFSAAAKQSPHFADPLEGWGEALMAQGDFKGAVAKFAQANKYAPRWDRLHEKWGAALAKLGKADEARAQTAMAATLKAANR